MRRVLGDRHGWRSVPQTPAADRTGLRRYQVQPPHRPLPASRALSGSLRMATDHRQRQPAQAAPSPTQTRERLNRAPRGPRPPQPAGRTNRPPLTRQAHRRCAGRRPAHHAAPRRVRPLRNSLHGKRESARDRNCASDAGAGPTQPRDRNCGSAPARLALRITRDRSPGRTMTWALRLAAAASARLPLVVARRPAHTRAALTAPRSSRLVRCQPPALARCARASLRARQLSALCSRATRT